MRNTLRVLLCTSLSAVLLAGSLTQAATTIQTVPVGNPGKPKDSATGNLYGQVNYNYNIGKYEVTAGQYTAFLNAVAKTDTYGLYNTLMADPVSELGCNIQRSGSSGSFNYSVAPDWANRPVNYVSFWDATRFANWLHNGQPTGAQNAFTTEDGAYTLTPGAISGNTITRNSRALWAVTSEDEWYKAAYYNPATNSYYLYPTSSNSAPGQNMADTNGNNANFYGSLSPIDSGNFITVVGEFQNSKSPYGTFDQGGNMFEWNQAIIDGSFRGLRGGSFSFDFDSMQSGLRYYIDPSNERNHFGFRVSQIPEPASITLLGLGTITLLIRRSSGGRTNSVASELALGVPHAQVEHRLPL